jgi:hypothetical protein
MRNQRLEDIAVRLRTGGHATTDIVKLNVGGEQLTVSRAALLSQPDTPLAALFTRSHELPTDVNGAVFLDRDARYFRYVIDYLRNGCPRYLHGLPMENSELERIKQEFVYFGLPVPMCVHQCYRMLTAVYLVVCIIRCLACHLSASEKTAENGDDQLCIFLASNAEI